MPNEKADVPHVLDDPPPFHSKLLDYGERPYWSADGTRIAFIETNYGDACELDVETGKVRNLTRDLGQHHRFLRVLIFSNGDYLLIGPRTFKDRDISRHVESELWVMDKNATRPPKPLGRRMFEGCGVSTFAPRITYAVSGRNDPSLGDPDVFECHVTDIDYGDDGPELGADEVFYRTRGSCARNLRTSATTTMRSSWRNTSAGGPPHPRCVVKGVASTGGVHDLRRRGERAQRVRGHLSRRRLHLPGVLLRHRLAALPAARPVEAQAGRLPAPRPDDLDAGGSHLEGDELQRQPGRTLAGLHGGTPWTRRDSGGGWVCSTSPPGRRPPKRRSGRHPPTALGRTRRSSSACRFPEGNAGAPAGSEERWPA